MGRLLIGRMTGHILSGRQAGFACSGGHAAGEYTTAVRRAEKCFISRAFGGAGFFCCGIAAAVVIRRVTEIQAPGERKGTENGDGRRRKRQKRKNSGER